ncbi:hypothetical protein [Caudoviricetes sp.]|nr:hypothetical protein [Caudoviricetes sp.]
MHLKQVGKSAYEAESDERLRCRVAYHAVAVPRGWLMPIPHTIRNCVLRSRRR